MTSKYQKRYCIVGGGAGGIGLGKALTEGGLEFDIIEAESDFGGNWRYGAATSKMYQSAHLISSKQSTEFSDFPMPQSYPHYPNHELMLNYLQSLARHYELYSQVQFNTRVKSVLPVSSGCKVILSSGEEREYHAVIIANGMLREPKYPIYPGKFKGKVFHSVDYISPDAFAGKRVLVVGAGNSGCDIAVDLVPKAAKVYHSTRRGYHYMPKFIDGLPVQKWLSVIRNEIDDAHAYWDHVTSTFKLAGFAGSDYGLPQPDHEIYQAHPIMNSLILYRIGHGDIIPKPDIREFKGRKVVFLDGSVVEFDVIIYATGFKMSFPFLSKDILPSTSLKEDTFMNSFHKKTDHLIFAGYFNSPSGLGNLSNAGGKLMTSYLKALYNNKQSIRIFNQLKQNAGLLDLSGDFMKTERHENEFDLYKVLKGMKWLSEKFLA